MTAFQLFNGKREAYTPVKAKKIVRELAKKPDLLPVFPQMGHKVPEINDDTLREISLHPWRIIYHLRQDKIFIVTVEYKRRQLEADELAWH